MSNYGALTLKVVDQDGSQECLITNVVSAKGTSALNRVGSGECVIKASDEVPGIERGNIAICYIQDNIAGRVLSVCAFTIEEIHRKTSPDGMSEVRMAGRDLLAELTGYLHFFDIGDTYITTLAVEETATDGEQALDVLSLGATKTYIDNYQPGSHVDVNDASSFTAGDSIILQQDDDSEGGHLATITNILANAIAFTPALPGSMSSYGEVYIPEVWEGDSVRVSLGTPIPDGSYHYSRISKVPAAGINGGDTCDIRIADGISATAANVNDVVVISPSTPTTDDIAWIMEPAVTQSDWTVDTSAAGTPYDGISNWGGTATGTGHSVDGANTLELLINTNELTTEWFRWERAMQPVSR